MHCSGPGREGSRLIRSHEALGMIRKFSTTISITYGNKNRLQQFLGVLLPPINKPTAVSINSYKENNRATQRVFGSMQNRALVARVVNTFIDTIWF